VSGFFAALQFLTVFPRPACIAYRSDETGRAAVYFPVVGLLLGFILALANAALEPLAGAALSSVALVALLALMTGGLHLDGLADTFDGLGAGGGGERMLEIMQDSRTGAFGVSAIVLLCLFKIHALELIEVERWRALLNAPLLGRWAMVLLGYQAQAAKSGLGSAFVAQLNTTHVVCATLLAAGFSAAIARGRGLLIMLGLAIFVIVARSYFQRRLGGITGDTLGAVGELSEALVLVFYALAHR
jgi:adenosylcobinamide-GDP ribazoletransferase